MSRSGPTIMGLILVFCSLSPAQAVGQGKGTAGDSARLQQLYEVVSARYGPQVECRIGTLKGGRHFAQVTITDSAAFHSPPETQREAAKAVATYVKDQLKNDPALETIRVGWKYSPAGGFSSAITYDFVKADLEPDPSGRSPS